MSRLTKIIIGILVLLVLSVIGHMIDPYPEGSKTTPSETSVPATKWYRVTEESGEGSILLSSTEPSIEPGQFVLSEADYLRYGELGHEIYKPEYKNMEDKEMLSLIGTKWGTTGEALKKLYIRGMVVDEGLKKGTIK